MKDSVRGIITVLNTPFLKDDSIDLAGLQANVRSAIQAGVAGFLVPAMASEVGHLSAAEKRSVVELVVSESRDRAVVIGGASADSQRERIRLAEDFLSLGCNGVLVQMTEESGLPMMERDLLALDALEPDILMLQDWDASGYGISLATLLHLFERVERFNWLKIEVKDAGPKYSEVLKATKGNLNVAGGWAVTKMIDGLDRGVHAFMPTAMHRVYVEIYRMFQAGRRTDAAELFEQIKPILAFSNQSLEVSIQFFKRMLFAQQMYATQNVRITAQPFATEERRTADSLIALATQIDAQLPATDSSTAS